MGLHTAIVGLTRGPPQVSPELRTIYGAGIGWFTQLRLPSFATRIIFGTASCDDASGAEIAACQSLTSDLVV